MSILVMLGDCARMVGDCRGDGGCPSLLWWATVHGLVGDQTIQEMVGDRPGDCGFRVTILGRVGDCFKDGG